MRTRAAVLAGALAALALTGCVADGQGPAATGEAAPGRSASGEAAPEPQGAPVALPAPEGLRARVETTGESRGDGLIDWRAAWVLEWDAVLGAGGYVARFSTSEGGGRERALTATRLRVDAAAGTSPPERVERDAAEQLALAGSQLAVRVAAIGSGGSVGALSDRYAVGAVTSPRG